MNNQVQIRKQRYKILARALFVILLLYVLTYIPNSLTGGWIANESGKIRLLGGLANCDQYIWMPRFGVCQIFQWSNGRNGIKVQGLGYFYCPLILIDQAYFHRTIRFFNENMMEAKPYPFPPIEKFHPTMVNPFAGRFPYQAVTNQMTEALEQTASPNGTNRAVGAP